MEPFMGRDHRSVRFEMSDGESVDSSRFAESRAPFPRNVGQLGVGAELFALARAAGHPRADWGAGEPAASGTPT
jgi:hypothetical protein